MIGRTLGRYRIVAKLGEGGMGSVWRAEDPALGRTVALKLLSSALWASDTARRRFLREARAASQLDHPNIATVYDVGETDGLAWIAYQFVDGETLAARTAAGPLPIAEAVALANETAQALAHAHARGVLHRDVTAGNVIVTREGHAILVDFGLALPEHGGDLTATGTTLGTAGYMAPEVMRGEPADARSDLYALGAVSYRMLTGRLPFEGGPPEAVLYRVLNEKIPPPSELRPELPPSLERVVLRLLERDPADRYASAIDVTEALREVQPELGPTGVERARRTMARRFRRTREALRRVGRKRVGVMALASISLFAVALWFAAQRGWLPGTTAKPPTLAVLPFKNETGDPEGTAYIADGLAEALAVNLSQTARLRVLPWVTTERVRLDSMPLPKVAKELHAKRLLLGTLRSSGEGLTVSLTLVDGNDGTQTWGRPFEGSADELPALEARMLFETANAILGKLTPDERARMELPSGRDGRAYNLYLEGASQLRAGDPVSLATAEQFFERSLTLDSTFADAHVGLGAVYNARYFAGAEGGLRNFQLAREHFERGAELDPSSALAMRALVNLRWQQGRLEDCLALGMRAARAQPQSLEMRLVVVEAYVLGDLPEVGQKLAEQVLAEDPSNPSARFWAVVAAAWSGRSEAVLRHGAEYIKRFGEYYEIYLWMELAALELGQREKALALARRCLELEGDAGDPRVLMFLARVEDATIGRQSAQATRLRLRRALSERLERDPDQPRNRLLLMATLGALGDHDEVLRNWKLLSPAFWDPDAHGTPDYDRLPAVLLEAGATEEAHGVIRELERRRFFGVAMEPLTQLLGATSQRDSMLATYRAMGRRHHAEMMARYGKP